MAFQLKQVKFKISKIFQLHLRNRLLRKLNLVLVLELKLPGVPLLWLYRNVSNAEK